MTLVISFCFLVASTRERKHAIIVFVESASDHLLQVPGLDPIALRMKFPVCELWGTHSERSGGSGTLNQRLFYPLNKALSGHVALRLPVPGGASELL
jgi:hypothetical protein